MEKKRKGLIAQRDEESELRAPICLNNCGFPGSSATDNACSPGSAPPIWSPDLAIPADEAKRVGATAEAAAVETPRASREVNRCLACRKRVGLTGFWCRCGGLFCREHRYSDRHNCGFDYKAAARAKIAQANPVIRAAKIARI